MADTQQIPVSELQVGDRLAQDIMVGSQVLLRKGTVLQLHQISRMKRLPLEVIIIEDRRGNAPPKIQPEVIEEKPHTPPTPEFKDFEDEETPSWLADEHFNTEVPVPPVLPQSETLFAERKDEIRKRGGLVPVIDSTTDAKLQKDIHATLINAAVSKRVDLKTLADTAGRLSSALREYKPEGYITCRDITRYGEHLVASALMSIKVIRQYKADYAFDQFEQHVRCQLALVNAHAVLPVRPAMNGATQTGVVRAKTRDALLRYCSWLNSCKFVEDDVLKTMCLQFERFDGSGLPYGLKDEQIPELSESWAMAQMYSSKLHSRPKEARVDGRTAGEHLVSQSGRVFNGKRVNKFLTAIGFYPQGSLVELNDKRLAVVIRQNETALLKPQVQTVDVNGGVVETINLQSAPELYITRQVMEY